MEKEIDGELREKITHIISDEITCTCYLCVGDVVTPKLLPLFEQVRQQERERINTELEDILTAADGDYYSRIQALRVRLSREAGL